MNSHYRSMAMSPRALVAAGIFVAALGTSAQAAQGSASAQLDFDFDFSSPASRFYDQSTSQSADYRAPVSGSVFGNNVIWQPMPLTTLEKTISNTHYVNSAENSGISGHAAASFESSVFEKDWTGLENVAHLSGTLLLAAGDSVTIHWTSSASSTKYNSPAPNEPDSIYPMAYSTLSLNKTSGDLVINSSVTAGWPQSYIDYGDPQTRFDSGSFSRTVTNTSSGDMYYWLEAEASVSAWVSSVATIPEPGTYALFLAGLAVVGGVSRRRQRGGLPG